MSSPIIFAWGLTRGDVSSEDNLLDAPGLICYRGKAVEKQIGEDGLLLDEEAVALNNPNDRAVVINRPTRTLYLSTMCDNCSTPTGIKLVVRLVYDVVTLTSAEQADLFNYCCSS
jgi:hypothetical protein